MLRRPRQLALPAPRTWGGKRAGAGRKPGARRVVLHRARPPHLARHPVHITLRARAGLPSLRADNLVALIGATVAAVDRPDARVVHFSVQGDHVHLVLEAHDERVLSSVVRGLSIRIARAINRLLKLTGRVWADRYHRRDLRTPSEVRVGLRYVLQNWAKHGRRTAELDPCSSAGVFDGWKDASPRRPPCPGRVRRARTWLLTVGWRRAGGLISVHEMPAGARDRRSRWRSSG
jgi:REP element-mobilizing transposase RayT